MKRIILASAAACFLMLAPVRAQERASLDDVLDRATTYVGEFVAKFSGVVAEEVYDQEYLQASIESGGGTSRMTTSRPGNSIEAPSMPRTGALRTTDRRKLRSDVLLVKPPELDGWQVFRDVYEVDGRPVRDREDRLTKLFVDTRNTTSAIERAQSIVAEGARFNIRPIGTVDNPLLALTFLQHPLRERFRFIDRGVDGSTGTNARLIEFRETARPTIIRTGQDKDIFAKGRWWIDTASGALVKTEVIFAALGSESSVTTTFAQDDRLGLRVPAEMHFKRSFATNEVRCVATYGRFRTFQIQTDESLQR